MFKLGRKRYGLLLAVRMNLRLDPDRIGLRPDREVRGQASTAGLDEHDILESRRYLGLPGRTIAPQLLQIDRRMLHRRLTITRSNLRDTQREHGGPQTPPAGGNVELDRERFRQLYRPASGRQRILPELCERR